MIGKLQLTEKSVVPYRGACHRTLHPGDAQALGVCTQILRYQNGVEMQRIAQA